MPPWRFLVYYCITESLLDAWNHLFTMPHKIFISFYMAKFQINSYNIMKLLYFFIIIIFLWCYAISNFMFTITICIKNI